MASATDGDPEAPPILSSPHNGSHAYGLDQRRPLHSAHFIFSPAHNPFGPCMYSTQSNLPVATSGDPTEPDILFSLLTVRGLLYDSDGAALTWPAFALLRGAALASKQARFRMAHTTLVLAARLVF